MKEKLIRYRPGIDPKPADRTTDEELAHMFRPGALRQLRERLGLSQAAFAERFHRNLRTLQDWEQARRVPEDIARTYLRVIEHSPDAVAAALNETETAF